MYYFVIWQNQSVKIPRTLQQHGLLCFPLCESDVTSTNHSADLFTVTFVLFSVRFTLLKNVPFLRFLTEEEKAAVISNEKACQVFVYPCRTACVRVDVDVVAVVVVVVASVGDGGGGSGGGCVW